MPPADSPHAATVVVILGVVGVILTIAVAILTIVKLWRGLTAPKPPASDRGLTSIERDADVEARLRRVERHALASGRTDNWNPTAVSSYNLTTASVLYVTANAAGSQLSGIVAVADGDEKTLYPDATGVLTGCASRPTSCAFATAAAA